MSRLRLLISLEDRFKVCYECGEEADYVDSVPDKEKEGMHPSECGYSRRYFCKVHGDRRLALVGNTSRLTLLPCDPWDLAAWGELK